MHRVSAIWSLAGLALVACGSVPDSPEHVWLQRGTVLAADELEVDEHVTVRWSHFVGSDKGWYSWGYVRDSSGNFLDSITGNTKATGVFAWQVPARLCGKKIQVEMCSGSPPRKTKHACHRSKGFLVRGDCSEDSSTRSVEGIEGTTATTTLSDVRELGPLPLHSRSRRWTPASASSQTTVTNTERPSDASVTSVAMVVVWLGRLPTFAGAFAETARGSGPTFLIFHTHDEEPPVRSDRVHFEHLTLKSLATRLWKTDVMQNVFSTMSFESFEDRVAECYADDNPAKGNDLKPLYGALFQEELRNYTHWGWTDLDMIWGRLDLFLTKDLLTKYDVISFPDGARPALYLSGQLTIFQNTPIWRHFVDGCLEGPGHVNYGGCYAERLLSEANLFFDEKLAIWFAALRHARIWVDFSPLLIEPRWSRLSGRGVQKLFREQGRLLVHGSQSLPFVDVERRNMEVHKLQNSSDCYTEFGLGWSFACVPTEGNDAFGIAYEIADQRLLLSPSLPRLVDSGVEFAAWHLHRSKQRFHWESQCQTVTCHRERSANISCECSSTGSGASWNLPIPNIVHFVLTDRDTRFFDWPCYAAIRSAWEKLQPEQLLVHVLDGVEPGTFDDWWQAARAFITAVVPFSRSTVPSSLNGLRLSHPAFIADFRRIQILHDWGGIYMDTDALSLREFEDLRGWRAVLARQGGVELRATVGLMMFEKHSPLLLPLLDRMRKAYTGSWGVHAGHVLDDMLAGIRPEGVAILAHSSGFFASSWHASDFVELMEESGIVDWSRCWSLHLYNSQTKRFTKDPVELCRDSSYKSGDLCNGLRLTVDMDDIYGMVGRGYPVMNSRIEEAFLKRADEQAALFDVPVSHSLDIQREAAQASRPEL